MGGVDMLKQSKPKGDIVALAYLLIIACLVQVAVGIVLIFFAGLLPNDYRIVFHIAQWSFALLAVLFPWIGILGAWKTMLSALLAFDFYCFAQLIWNILYIIGLAIRAPVHKKVPEIIFAGIEIVLAIIMIFLSSSMSLLLANYYRMQE